MVVERFKSFPLWIKAGLIIGVLGLSYVAWFLGSPLFLPGDTENEKISDVLEDPNSKLLFSGNFVQLDNAHWGEGKINIIEKPDGSLALFFIDVKIANGPALVVYLSDKLTFSGPNDNAGMYTDLGDLPFNNGDFSIEIPSNVVVSEYMSVLIWCEPFSIVFTYASFIVS